VTARRDVDVVIVGAGFADLYVSVVFEVEVEALDSRA
jgi:hypothetical protein